MKATHKPGHVSNDSERETYCTGHHERIRGAPRNSASEYQREFWLDGWDAADGELYDALFSANGSIKNWINAA